MTKGTSVIGLTSLEVNQRVAAGKRNNSVKQNSKTFSQIVFGNLFSVFNLVILAIILFLLFFFLKTYDNRLLLDSIGTSFVAILNTLIAIIQEIKAKRALDKVSLLLKREVTVIRDSSKITIDQNDIVVDDVILIERGDQVVVDGKVLESNNLEIDESLLTGESLPIIKKENDVVLSGSFCISGNGFYVAEKVGDDSYANEITRTAKKFKMNISPLQVRLNFIVKLLFATAVFLAGLTIIRDPSGFSNVDFIRKLSTIMLTLVPQGLVLMSSVTFALGIYRISKIGAIIQKLNAIESFSNVRVVCTDKTGTLTQNKLAVNKITLLNDAYKEDEVKKLLGTFAKFSSDKNATLQTLVGFPSEENVVVKDEMPFSSEKKMSMIQLVISNEQLTVVLGGYDILVDKSVNKENSNQLFENEGLKVYRNLLFGKVKSDKSFTELKENFSGLEIEPICIVSISDKVRDDVMDAINLFHKNDIDIKILSGDNAFAVQAIAKEIGWEIKDDELITGIETEEVKDENFFEVIMKKKIFARLKPEHKLRIIKTLKKEKIYTAMIGDGVNDLPAIKESDMGIAMEEGSKITKEVADIVLLKNKFALLPQIFDEGNKIVNTVASISKLFLTKNFLVIYFTVFSMFLMLDFPLTPRRVALINIFSIGLPSLIIALRNTNISKTVNFMKELFSFVILSSGIIVASAFIGQIISKQYPGFTDEDVQMVMLSIMIFITAANFLSVVIQKGEKNIRLYVLYAIGLIGLYSFFALTQIDFVVINFIKKFYEISYLKYHYWDIVIITGIVSSVILLAVQKIRKRFISGFNFNRMNSK